jgi:hypothetical protein
MKLIKTVFLIILCLVCRRGISGQDLSVPVNGGNSHDTKASGVHVYLHTDRSYYSPGESVLFKAYVLDDTEKNPASVNDTLHTAILDQEGLEVASGNFPLNNSMITGNIVLPEILTDGNYILIAYARPANRLSPEKIFSRIIEIKESVEAGLTTHLSLTDTLYDSGNQLTAQIKFSEKENSPVSAGFTYKLIGTSSEMLGGKSKTGSDGMSVLKLQLPSFDNKEVLKLIVIPSYKNAKTTGIVIPTQFNFTAGKKHFTQNMPENKFRHLNIQASTIKLQNDKVMLDISVTDDKGSPVMANLSVSASNIVPHQIFYEDNIVNYAFLKDNQPEFNLNADVKKYYAGLLQKITQTPGNQFIVQEKNNSKKLQKKRESPNQDKQYGYSSDRNIWDILMSVKSYHIDNGNIIFGISSMNSINSLDGALIIVDGIKMGTDASILNTIPVPDIARITASTNVMDIQRYSAMNNAGIIEITMKKTSDFLKKEENAGKAKSNTLFWEPYVLTDKFGKASISFINNNQSDDILISVEGIAASGLSGSCTLHYTGK